MNEVWKAVSGYEGLYQISNYGRIQSIGRYRNCNKGVAWFDGKTLLFSTNKEGYKQVVLYKNGIKKTHYVHRLVGENFIMNPDCLPCLNHKDETRDNNRADNLEWCTYSYNNTYGNAREKRLASTDINEAVKKRQKKVMQVSRDGTLIRVWDSLTLAAKGINSHESNINACCRGKQKTAKGFKWQYLDCEVV